MKGSKSSAKKGTKKSKLKHYNLWRGLAVFDRVKRVENYLCNIAFITSILCKTPPKCRIDAIMLQCAKLRDIKILSELMAIKIQIREILKPYNFKHHTVQVELRGEECSMDLLGKESVQKL